jgi:hypothetical protein
LIREHFEAENRDFFFTKDDKLAKEYKFLKDPKEIPKNGACIFLNKPNKEVILFKKTYQKFSMKYYLVGLKKNVP